MIKVYGIKNCDTVKKALKHLEKNGVEFEFVDFKKVIPTATDIKRWQKFSGDLPVNTRGRTYKMLKEKYEGSNASDKIAMIQENTSLIKRPVLEKGKTTLCLGYDPATYDSL